MLPDYPNVKEKINDNIQEYLWKQSNPVPLNEMNRKKVFEGDKSKIIDRSDEESIIEFKKLTSEEKEFDLSEFEDMSFKDILKKITQCGKEMSEQNMGLLIESMNEAVEKTGNEINVNGELKPEHVLEMLKKVNINFNSDGSIKSGYTFLIPPGAEEKLKRVLEKIQSDPELKEKHDKIIENKRREWRARENSRKLVR